MRAEVLIRVFDRTADLEICVECIRRLWTRGDYEILVISNGESSGHPVPDSVRKVARVISLPENAGHREGNSQLLREGVARLSERAEYVVLLEADTWLLDDALIETVTRRMRERDWVWASAEWEGRYHSLALDFAVVSADLIRREPGLLEFGPYPESEVANFLRGKGLGYGHIPELMPVHVPKAMRRFHTEHGGRFRAFPEGPMVTHHVEDLAGGIEEKKRIANRAAGRAVFDVRDAGDLGSERARLARLQAVARRVPRSDWFRRKRVKGA